MKRLLIDSSSVVKAALYASNTGPNAYMAEFEGKQEIIPSHLDGYEVWLGSLKKTLTDLNMVPSQCVLVKDGRNASELRRQFLPDYRKRKPRPSEFSQEFYQLQEKVEANLLAYGAISVVKDQVEADDFIFALAKVTDCVIWSLDGDMMAAGNMYCRGLVNPDRFYGIAKKHIVVYKSLVGDPADLVPGTPKFGEKSFIDMVAKFGDECLDEFLEFLENRTLSELAPYVGDFKPFQKILDNEELVYASYQCAKFHHPGWHDIEWKAKYPKGDGTWPEWDLKIELITKDKLTPEFFNQFQKQLNQVPWGPSFDIETWSDEESLAWGIANKSQRGPRLDVYGAHMAGFSITTGPNNNLVYYFPVDHLDTDNVSIDDMARLLNCCDESKPMFVFNAEFELPVVRNHMELRFDRGWLPNIHDVLIMKSYVNENTPLKLKTSTWTYLGYKQVTFEQVTAEPTDYQEDPEEEQEPDDSEPVPWRQMNTMTGLEVVDYGADDSICTGALANLFSLIMKYEETWNAFDMCEREPAYLCAEAFLNGQKFDLDTLAALTKDNAEKSAEIWEKINERLIKLEWIMGDPVDGVTWTAKLPGCVFEPAANLSASEIKKVYKQVTRVQLKSNLRSVSSLAKLMKDTAPELASALLWEDSDGLEVQAETVDKFNEVGAGLFVPKPELNLGSPKQMCDLLYTAMGFPVRLKGKLTDKMRAAGKVQGNPKGNESAIRHAIMYDATEEEKELLLLLIEAKALQTDYGLYLKPYVKMPNPKDGFVHGSYGQSRQTSRRFSSSAPNFSQQSHKSPIRKVVVPAVENHLMVSFDEAGQELRHAAVQSQDPAMLSCYIGDNLRDIHSITGRAIMEKKWEGLTYEEFIERIKAEETVASKARKYAKILNFLSQYGGTAVSLAEKLLISVEEAEELMAAKDAEFGRLVQWQAEVEVIHRERGFSITPLGARKHLRLEGSWKDAHELRSALNFIIQAAAAEQIKLVMKEIWNRRITDRFDCEYRFPVHDEHLFSCSKEDMAEFCREMHAIMIQPYGGLQIPWESSIAIGPSFGEMTEISGFDEEKIREIIKEVR